MRAQRAPLRPTVSPARLCRVVYAGFWRSDGDYPCVGQQISRRDNARRLSPSDLRTTLPDFCALAKRPLASPHRAEDWRGSVENPNTPGSPSCGTRARTLSYGPARACFCRLPTASKQSPTTMEKSSPLTSRSQPRWGRYPILPNHITRGNAGSTNTPTAYSDSTSQKVRISLLCQIPMSKGSRINSTLAPERYSAIELLVRFSSTSKISPLHFAVEWAHGCLCPWRLSSNDW